MWIKAKMKAAKETKNEAKSSEMKNVSPAKQFDQTFLKFDAPLNLTVNTLTDATNETNDIPYIVVNGTFLTFLNGDVNDDGEVALSDAMYLAKHVLGITGFEDVVEAAADVNDDGEVALSDAMYLAKHVLDIPGFEELK